MIQKIRYVLYWGHDTTLEEWCSVKKFQINAVYYVLRKQEEGEPVGHRARPQDNSPRVIIELDLLLKEFEDLIPESW